MKGHALFAATYDWCMQWAERKFLGVLRERILSEASGRVLEIGAGTGASFPYYGSVPQFVATEPDPYMMPRARARARRLGLHLALVQCLAEDLPFADATFDTIVSTLVLCSVEEPSRALSEIRRTLKPTGNLRFIEHVRFDDFRGHLQDLSVPVWSYIAAGCQPNRQTVESMQAAGFEILEQECEPTPLMPFVFGVATPNGMPR